MAPFLFQQGVIKSKSSFTIKQTIKGELLGKPPIISFQENAPQFSLKTGYSEAPLARKKGLLER